jgi:hypothetical protein
MRKINNQNIADVLGLYTARNHHHHGKTVQYSDQKTSKGQPQVSPEIPHLVFHS